jgi:cyclic dehypoxanthinyl futalosine synthase
MLSRAAALDMFRSDDLIAIGMEADAVRKRLHPSGIASYALEKSEEVVLAAGATPEETLDRLDALRRTQEETGGVIAVVPTVVEGATAVEYLKLLAISRIYLENIPNIQSSWAAPGLKTCQVALRFGANDVGCAEGATTEEDLRHIIRIAGFIPKQRDALYQTYFLN